MLGWDCTGGHVFREGAGRPVVGNSWGVCVLEGVGKCGYHVGKQVLREREWHPAIAAVGVVGIGVGIWVVGIVVVGLIEGKVLRGPIVVVTVRALSGTVGRISCWHTWMFIMERLGRIGSTIDLEGGFCCSLGAYLWSSGILAHALEHSMKASLLLSSLSRWILIQSRNWEI